MGQGLIQNSEDNDANPFMNNNEADQNNIVDAPPQKKKSKMQEGDEIVKY